MIKQDIYKTDFASEYRRWARKTPSEELLKATYKEQQEALATLREQSFLDLVLNKGVTIKTRNTEKVETALRNRER